jgi:hypothetical protein
MCVALAKLAVLAGAVSSCQSSSPKDEMASVRSTEGPEHPELLADSFKQRNAPIRQGAGSDGILTMSRLFGDSTMFGRVGAIRPVGRYLVVTEKLGSPHITILDRKTGEVALRFGRNGQGPNEFRGPDWLFTESHEPPEVWVYDYQNRRLSLLDLEAPPDSVIRNRIRLETGAHVEELAVLEGSMIAGGFYADATLLLLDQRGSVRSRIVGEPPFAEVKGLTPAGRMYLNENRVAFDPLRERVVIAYQMVSRIDFFTSAGVRYGSVVGPRQIHIPMYQVTDEGGFFWESETEAAYISVDASQEFVYALFDGSSIDEPTHPRLVHVFRWDGSFAGELTLDRDATSIAVDHSGLVIYGAVDEPYPAVAEWTIPRSLLLRH